jgi:TonB family protein
VDPVSRILSERERSRPRLFPYTMIALVLHGGLAGTIFLMSRNASARHAQLPAVSVRLIQPEPPKPRRRRAEPAAQPTRAPTNETPVPVATAAPEIEAPTQRASEDALAAPEQKATPLPTQPPAPASGGSGLSIGGDNDRQMPGIPSDFRFAYYVQRMLALIESRWYKPAAPSETRALVRFTINRDGRVSRIELESSSGNSSFDRAALRALYAANPLPPLPPAYRKPSLTVHLTFSE